MMFLTEIDIAAIDIAESKRAGDSHYETCRRFVFGARDGTTATERALEEACDRLITGAALTEFFAIVRLVEARRNR